MHQYRGHDNQKSTALDWSCCQVDGLAPPQADPLRRVGYWHQSTRAQGGQRKRFKDNLKANFKVCHIGLTTWEDLARDRPRWRHAVQESVALFEKERRQKAEEKRQRHKEHEVAPALSQHAPYICPACGKACHSRIGLFSHQRVHKTRS